MIRIKQQQDTRFYVSASQAFAYVKVQFTSSKGQTIEVEFDMETYCAFANRMDAKQEMLQVLKDLPWYKRLFNNVRRSLRHAKKRSLK